ncbi:hypothetical protein [Brasilonema bromeliae]|nr:hypothetical protein [Brasilonema bromeliae]
MRQHQRFLTKDSLSAVTAGKVHTMSSLPNSNPYNPYVRLLGIIFSLGVALGSGLGYGFSQAISSTKQQKLPTQTELCYVSRIEYERLQPGMSLTDVQAILGSGGTEVDRTATTATFIWENPNGYKITTVFNIGKLESKKQTGLR